jgi:hypothetical protein
MAVGLMAMGLMAVGFLAVGLTAWLARSGRIAGSAAARDRIEGEP